VLYHLGGRDIRVDVVELWHAHLTAEQLLSAGLAAAQLFALAFGAGVARPMVGRARARIEAAPPARLPPALEGAGPLPDDVALPTDDYPRTVTRWFNILERLAQAMILFGSLMLAARITRAPLLGRVVDFALPLVSTVLIARLLTLAARTLSRALAGVGN